MNSIKIGVVVLAGGDIQHKAIWPSYNNTDAGIMHDLIVVHRDKLNLPSTIINNYGLVIYLNKIINGVDVPHRAFGGYRYAFNQLKSKYDYFVFVSDDVVIRRDDWLKDIINSLNSHEMIGFGASQIFNGQKKYPHPSHLRAPFWFAKTEVLNKIDWQFNSDHDGEMKIGNQLAATGYIGIQVGNKIDLAFDSFEPAHITQILEKKYFPDKNLVSKFEKGEFDYFRKKLNTINSDSILNENIISPYAHINKQNVFIDIEPFDKLIFLPTLESAKKYLNVKEIVKNTFVYE